jgi:hypothetical protein
MRSTLILAALLFAGTAFAQVPLLNNFDFSQGDYTILVIPQSDNDDFDEGLMDTTVAVAYFDQIPRLHTIQQTLVGEKYITDQIPPWPPTHFLEVCKNGKSEQHLEWETPWGYIGAPDRYHAYRGDFDFKGYQLARLQHFEYQNLHQARRALDSLRRQPGIIYVPDPLWKDYEGEFKFTAVQDGPNEVALYAKCKAEIEKYHPGEPFELKLMGRLGNYLGAPMKFYFIVRCNRSLFEDFQMDIDPSLADYSGTWWEYPLYLRSYWKQDQQSGSAPSSRDD